MNSTARGPSSQLVAAALYLEAGLSIIPCESRGKKPKVPWKRFQNERPDERLLHSWFSGNDLNLAIVCGVVSGNLVVLDFDVPGIYEKWAAGHPDVANVAPTVKTSRGRHVYL